VDTTIPGIHHITAIAGDPQQNVDFYSGLLGLRLVKRTVNFDDPGSYHLYYGDAAGHPGTIMTFFAWPGVPRGRQGAGQIGATAFSIPPESTHYWTDRLQQNGVTVKTSGPRFGETVLAFDDPDGMTLELIAAPNDSRPGWRDGPVPAEHAIRGFHSATLWIQRHAPSAALLAGVMGFQRIGQEGDRLRYATGSGEPGAMVDLLAIPAAPRALQAAGTVHHIAWRVAGDADELAWQQELKRNGVHVTDVRDRQYFHSIYYREPGGILYEIATDPPGFTVDEPEDALGTALKLPPWLEPKRAEIDALLPPIHLPAPVGGA
jgi:glyoxalase family protein